MGGSVDESSSSRDEYGEMNFTLFMPRRQTTAYSQWWDIEQHIARAEGRSHMTSQWKSNEDGSSPVAQGSSHKAMMCKGKKRLAWEAEGELLVWVYPGLHSQIESKAPAWKEKQEESDAEKKLPEWQKVTG